MATTASPLSPTVVAGPSGSNPSSSRDPPRASRPSQPRPTTYTGLPPTTASAPQNQGSVAIPPRTSSNRQGPSMTTASEQRPAERSRSTSDRAPQNADRRNDRERERDAADGRSRRTAAQPQPTDGPQRRHSTNQREDGSRRTNGQGNAAPLEQTTSQVVAAANGSGERRDAKGRKETRFGDYILGQTLGEGEFGKVKLGWRRDGGVQVAIKLIRRDTLAPHPSRLSKIYREISILRTLSHPNIVRLHEMVETERHIGIILEYASGGELFDFILTHRFLKDPPACRLFAQLVSGVGYLHKKGIVHRDLKLENLLLDRNRNIIITDFGFANVFDPNDELGEELESRLNDPEVLKELELGLPRKEDGSGGIWDELGLKGGIRRRGDLMATSCGSPCYAAPELVVSDGLYTGRKVDVWSCGVILYAMLAGYLPFDDDPANPEGDNINLLYKYIVSTPLTFPEYVSPHARDLLRRILVPDPRKRADLFEVARHSWLAPFANVVGLITSSTTSERDIANTTVGNDMAAEVPLLTRSASVREPSTTTSAHPHATIMGGSGSRGGHHEHNSAPTQQKAPVDNKRRTVQVEYVAPSSQTRRGDSGAQQQQSRHTESGRHANTRDRQPNKEVVVPKPDASLARAATTHHTSNNRPSTGSAYAEPSTGRPSTAGDGNRLPVPQNKTRPASYQHQQHQQHQPQAAPAREHDYPERRQSTKQPISPIILNKPLPPTQQLQQMNIRPGTSGSATAAQQAQKQQNARTQQQSYRDSAPVLPTVTTTTTQDNAAQFGTIGLPSTQPMPPPQPLNKFGPSTQEALGQNSKGHKRANTVTGSGGVFSRLIPGSGPSASSQNIAQEKSPRQSVDQSNTTVPGAKVTQPPKNRRFSLLLPSFGLRGSSSEKRGHERRPSRSASGNSVAQRKWDNQQQQQQIVGGGSSLPQLGVPAARHDGSLSGGSDASLVPPATAPGAAASQQPYTIPSAPNGEPMPTAENDDTVPASTDRPSEEARKRPGVLQKNRKFSEAYEVDGQGQGSSGSSGAARRVMDFFRRRRVNGNK